MGRYYWFAYSSDQADRIKQQGDPERSDDPEQPDNPEEPKKPEPPDRPHLLRDGAAFTELTSILVDQGMRYGGLILNFPASRDHDRNVARPVKHRLHANDLLVLTTRPPVANEFEADKKRVVRSYTSLESRVLRALSSVFDTCTRSRVVLSMSVAGQLDITDRDRAITCFFQYSHNESEPERKSIKKGQKSEHDPESAKKVKKSPWAVYQTRFVHPDDKREESVEQNPRTKAKTKPTEPPLTAAFLAYIPHIVPGGPGLLASFGMGGSETLVWNHLLREKADLRSLVTRPIFGTQRRRASFSLAEIEIGPYPEIPEDLSWAERWNYRLLLDGVYPRKT